MEHSNSLQEEQLRQTLSESESDLSSEELGFEEKGEPSFGAFASFFYDPVVKEAVTPFLDINEDYQRELFADVASSESEEEEYRTTNFLYFSFLPFVLPFFF